MAALRFCLAIDHGIWRGDDPASAIERTFQLARLADESGFDSLWLTEDPDGWDAFALLAAMSRETQAIRLGTGVTNPFHRNPNQIAASVATVDRLSGGRAFLGIGRGQPEIYENVFGMDSSDPLARLENAIGLLRQWWQGQGVASGLGLVEGAEWRRAVLPLGLPPIYIAAVGPKALSLAGRVADGVLFNEMATPEFVRFAVDVSSAAALEAGRPPSALSFFVNPGVLVTDDPEPVLERKKSLIALIHALPGMERLLMTDKWDVSGIMGGVRQAMKTQAILARGGHFSEMKQAGDLRHARALIPTGLVEEATAIGSVDVVRRKLRRFAAAGATHVFVDRRGLPEDQEELRSMLARVSPF